MKFISPSRTIQIAIAIAINSEFQLLLDPREIGLEICYPKYDAHYTSAIALSIANRLQRNPIQIADAIAQTCAQNPEISAQSQIRAFGKGWLNIVFSEQYIAEILLFLENLRIEGITNCDGFWQKCEIVLIPIGDSTEQYVYTRCCALMRLAQQLNVGAIHELPLHLIADLEPVEISLLMRSLAIADYLADENDSPLNRQKKQKLSRSLAEAFLHFYDRCRIFGVPHEIAIKRLLLISITQKMLLAIAPSEINYATYL
ncbi:DALR anticodon-binding domain-containing protein [Pseudanabaena sp. BC1403]|uniref:DALR anticodon-binding domain-containing protein n=1 Tax=Pseudanabaena sp. BC1403 TaxID=2043171 RepID=UPI000CD81ECB|nr:DALR anticodon-binding domain-containing protein [Pseudanabaena sp. BC1403]